MGPRSDNRGYGQRREPMTARRSTLQWVHGPITVVMHRHHARSVAMPELQWVHGPITVVMRASTVVLRHGGLASMGPRSDNRGYAANGDARRPSAVQLQWVHGPITVVMRAAWSDSERIRIAASMGPRSDNRGYGRRAAAIGSSYDGLQWVHGPITVVIDRAMRALADARRASMGPRSDNRGYRVDSSTV